MWLICQCTDVPHLSASIQKNTVINSMTFKMINKIFSIHKTVSL